MDADAAAGHDALSSDRMLAYYLFRGGAPRHSRQGDVYNGSCWLGLDFRIELTKRLLLGSRGGGEWLGEAGW